MDRSVIERAHGALQQAVERYDMMGFYDKEYAEDFQLAEAKEAEDALAALGLELEKTPKKNPGLVARLKGGVS